MWVVHWGLLPRLPGGAWVAPVRPRGGGGAAAWVAGVLAAPGPQGGWRLGQQETQCSRRYGSQYWPLRSSVLAWRTPDREAWQATVYRVAKSRTGPKRLYVHKHKTFFSFFPGAALPQWELSMKVVQLLGLQGPWQRQVCRDTDCLCSRSYGPTRVFSWASCSWRSDGLFGQSFSMAPPVQALGGIPCLGTFSAVQHIRHIEGHPGWGPTL